MDKKISNEYKLFLISLIRNNSYSNGSYHKSEVSFEYKDNNNKSISVKFEYSIIKRFFTKILINVTGFNYFMRYDMGFRLFFMFNRVNWGLYKGLNSIKKKVNIEVYNAQYNKMASSLPKNYIRLKKIKKLVK